MIKNNRLRRILVLGLCVAGALQSPPLRAQSASRPNIILIMADDMGYSDIGCYGGEIQTPNLNGLAADGLRFTQFYNTARCCPTRACLLTGLYPHQAGVGHMMNDTGYPAYRGNLNEQCVTIAEVLRGAGYDTYMSGKWHVTRHVAPEGPKFNWPVQRGFERFFGTITGAGSYYDPATLTLGNVQVAPPQITRPGRGFYYTDAIADYAARCIREHDPSRPFFLYVAFTAPHWPLHAKPGDIAKYRGKYDAGWDAARRRRYERMLKMGLIKPEWGLSPRDARVPEWEKEANKAWNARCMEVYAAQVDCLDQGVGRILKALRASGQWDNTLIFFLADNGGCAEAIGRRGKPRPLAKNPQQLRPMKPDELQTRIIPVQTRDGRPVRQGVGVMPGPEDTYISYGRPWANVSNTPFREYKHWVHEGGISSPLIIHWPKAIPPSRRNAFVQDPAHLIDIMATCVDVAGATYPARYRGRDILPMEGVSLFWEHEGNRAVREGKWKLVAKNRRPWELYDMERDRSELHDLAAQHPELVRRLAAEWEAWAKRCGVQPWPLKRFGAKPVRAKAETKEAPTKSAPKKRPNILFAIADDWGWPHAGAYGDPVVRTPVFDRLAEQGVLFANAFVTSPSCTPSRGSILTGQWHWRLEENANLWSTLDVKFKTYPELLEKAGYFIGHWRKGWGPGDFRAGGRTRAPSGPAFRGFADFLKKRPKDKPFCFWLGSYDPHRPYKWRSGARSGLDVDRVQVPPCLPDCALVRNDIADYYAEVERFDRDVGEALRLLEEAGELDNTLIVVTGDNGMPFPRCKSNIYDGGTHVPLVVYWAASPGKGRVVEDFVSLADLAPTFLEAAGVKPPPEMTARSLLPLLKANRSGWIDPARDHVLTGKERHVPCQEPGNMGGYPCRAIRTRDFLYIRNFKPERWPAGVPGVGDYGSWYADCDNSPTKEYMIRRRREPRVAALFRLAFDKRPAEELYDLRSDPGQLLNVAYDPRYQDVRRELAERLLRELRETGDPRVVGGGDKFDAYPYRNRGRKRNPPKRPAPPKSAKPASAAAR